MPRSRTTLSLVGAAALLAASAAQAGTLTSATWMETIQGFPMNRSGGQLGATGTSTATAISVSLSYPQTTIKFFIPKTPNGLPVDRAVTITQGGAQALTATPSMGNATQGVMGMLTVMTASHNTKGVNQSTFMAGYLYLVRVPLGVGAAGQATGTFAAGVGDLHSYTVDFYAWTPGTLVFAGLSTLGMSTMDIVPLPNVTAAGTWNLTAGGGGTVTLVSPTKISIDCRLSQRRTVNVTSLKLYFVPEPASLLLLSAGAIALALRARLGR